MSASRTGPRGGVVLLAAGRSRRFGSDKRAHLLPDGRPLLTHSLERYGRAFTHCILVLRPDDPEPVVPATLPMAPQIVRAALADRGMGHSLGAGAAAAAGWDYLFIALADMPWVSAATLGELRSAMEHKLQAGATRVILQPLYGGRPGHPVGFSADFRAALESLQGDEGARGVLHRHADAICRFEVDDPGVLRDLDTPDS